MRIICPNCDAQYEVDASAIPEGGRDVQCSNCGHAWFQEKTDLQEDLTAALYEDPVAEDPPVSQALDQADDDDVGPDPGDDAAEPPALPAAGVAPVKRSLDDAVLAVLREEAEREIAARKAEAGSLETQGDLGLPPPVPPGVGSAAERAARDARAEPELNEAERRIKTLKGEPLPAPKAAARRDLLPDIEEINSTLRPSDAEAMQDVDSLPDLSRRSRSGFRSGFSLVLLLAVIIVALYIMAPRISEQIPGAAAAMTSYVEVIDGMRAQLDQLIQKATAMLRGASDGAQ